MDPHYERVSELHQQVSLTYIKIRAGYKLTLNLSVHVL